MLAYTSMQLTPGPHARTRAWLVGCVLLLGNACSTILIDPKGKGSAAPSGGGSSGDTSSAIYPKAIVGRDEAQDAVRNEAELAKTYDTPAPPGEAWFKVLPGTSRVLVTAPHATSQIREGKVKVADNGTGALALSLHKLAKVTVVYTTYQAASDPNYYDDNDFKATVKRLVEQTKPTVVLDLHMSDGDRPYDVDFGTMRGQSLRGKSVLLTQLADRLEAEGISSLSQDYFPAQKQQTITKWVSALGVPAIQCEINETWMVPPAAVAGSPGGRMQRHRFAQLLQAFVRYIAAIDGGK